MVLGFSTTYTISAYHHKRYEFETCSWLGVLDTLCDKVCQWFATGRWFSPGTPVSSNNKTDHHDITEILMKVALNTVNKPSIRFQNNLFFWSHNMIFNFQFNSMQMFLRHFGKFFFQIQSNDNHISLLESVQVFFIAYLNFIVGDPIIRGGRLGSHLPV
jgi:hypothetical protein